MRSSTAKQWAFNNLIEIRMAKKRILYEQWQTCSFSFISWIPEEVLQNVLKVYEQMYWYVYLNQS